MRVTSIIVGLLMLTFTACRSVTPPERRTLVGPFDPPYVDVEIRLRGYSMGDWSARTYRTYDDRDFAVLQKEWAGAELALAGQVRGFLWEIVSPRRFAGKTLTAHFDGLLPSGDPFTAFQFGKSYIMAVPENSIGNDSFKLCY
jgi:hypothetical protein